MKSLYSFAIHPSMNALLQAQSRSGVKFSLRIFQWSSMFLLDCWTTAGLC